MVGNDGISFILLVIKKSFVGKLTGDGKVLRGIWIYCGVGWTKIANSL